jgi:hypothetical protein
MKMERANGSFAFENGHFINFVITISTRAGIKKNKPNKKPINLSNSCTGTYF